MLLIGLTGGIGSGKSLVTSQLRQHDIPVLDCDEIYQELTRPGHAAFKSVIAAFGKAYVLDDGR